MANPTASERISVAKTSGARIGCGSRLLLLCSVAVTAASVFLICIKPAFGLQFRLNSGAETASLAKTGPEPRITGVNPAGVLAGGSGFDLWVYGEDFAPGSKVYWGEVELKGETFMSTRQLRVPVLADFVASAGDVEITVVNPEGRKTMPVIFRMSRPAPVVTILSLQSVIAGLEGYKIGIYGANFLRESTGEWNRSARATEFLSSGHLVLHLEAADIAKAGTGVVTVLNGEGERSNGKELKVVDPPPDLVGLLPEIRRLIPDVVDAGAGGFVLAVEGAGFVPESLVEWNGQAKETRYVSEERLEADILASDVGTAKIHFVTVKNPSQGLQAGDPPISNTGIVSVQNPVPMLTGLAPAAVKAGSEGFRLTLKGWGYVAGETSVSWNEREIESIYVSRDELTVEVPASYLVAEGIATIGVRNPSPGGGAWTKTFTIMTGEAPKAMLLYPRLVNRGGSADEREATGVAWVNLSGRDQTLTAWAYEDGGSAIEGEKITNPVSVAVPPEEQKAIEDWQVFGESFQEEGEGWLKLEGTEKRLTGFFMTYNTGNPLPKFSDGANALTAGMEEFVLPEVEELGFTEIHVANPNEEAATVTLELRDGAGQRHGAAVLRQVQGHGRMVEELRNLFEGAVAEGFYVRGVSDREVVSFEYMGKKPDYVYALNGLDGAGGGTLLYGPQYAVVAGRWRTVVTVVNLDRAGGTVTFRLMSDQGEQIGEAKSLAIDGSGKLMVTDQDFFGQGGDRSGYIEVRGGGLRLTGDVVFGDPERKTMATSLPLVSELLPAMVFSHVVSDETWWTGIALVNPSGTEASATLQLNDSNGMAIARRQIRMAAGSRLVGLLDQYFEELAGKQVQGYLQVTSDRGLAGCALFGTGELTISAIPPQTVPAD